MSSRTVPQLPPSINVMIGRWAVAAAPTQLRTLLGSCVAIILHDRAEMVGGLAHVVLPESRGRDDSVGKYADTAVPALLADLDTIRRRPNRGRPVASIVGGAAMFRSGPGTDVGRLNIEAVERILERLNIPVVARDAGGTNGRNVTLDIASGIVRVRVPGGQSYEL